MAPIDPAAALPTELVNLLAMHSSFLTALSLHFVHNGTGSPVDLKDLTETTTSVWRHRKVTYDDIRLCVGVLGAGPAARNNPFHLSDYGHGKICLEVADDFKMAAGLSQMNEDVLKIWFMESLDHLWRHWTTAKQNTPVKTDARVIATPRKRGRGRPKKADSLQSSIQAFVDEPSIAKFVAQLPHAEITTCESLIAIAPIQEKGRKRLREFKDSVQQGRALKKTRETTGKENEPAQSAPAQTKMTDFTSIRKTNLLDRILAKEAAVACGPKPLTPVELQRRAALQRSEEVLSVLSLLCMSKGPGLRVSFSMNALMQNLQSSIRTPISKEEALKCIEVLANEVTPGYVSVVRMGALSSVVVNQAMRPVDVKGRLVALGAY